MSLSQVFRPGWQQTFAVSSFVEDGRQQMFLLVGFGWCEDPGRIQSSGVQVPRGWQCPECQFSATPICATPEADISILPRTRSTLNKISKLEKVLEVLSDSTGPVVDVLKLELEKVPPFEHADFFDPRFWQNWKRSAQPKPSCSGRPGSACASWRQFVVHKSAMRGKGSPEWRCGETQSAPAVVRVTCCTRHHPTNANIWFQESSASVEDRQSDMQEAMLCGNMKKLLEVTSFQAAWFT